MVDCSHANSGKDVSRQPTVAGELCRQIGEGERAIIGVMLESNLVGGRQSLGGDSPLVRGQSVTDACVLLFWTDTVPVLSALARAVRQRRKSRP